MNETKNILILVPHKNLLETIQGQIQSNFNKAAFVTGETLHGAHQHLDKAAAGDYDAAIICGFEEYDLKDPYFFRTDGVSFATKLRDRAPSLPILGIATARVGQQRFNDLASGAPSVNSVWHYHWQSKTEDFHYGDWLRHRTQHRP